MAAPCAHTEKARFRILIVDGVLTTGTEDFFHDDSYTTIIEVGGAPSSALGYALSTKA